MAGFVGSDFFTLEDYLTFEDPTYTPLYIPSWSYGNGFSSLDHFNQALSYDNIHQTMDADSVNPQALRIDQVPTLAPLNNPAINNADSAASSSTQNVPAPSSGNDDQQDGEVEESKRGISYAQTLFKCLMSSAPKYEMELQDIYAWYARNTVKGRKAKTVKEQTAWKNSIRHNLSMSDEFVKGTRAGERVNSTWHLAEEVLARGKILPTTRFRRNANAARNPDRNPEAPKPVNVRSREARRLSGAQGGKASKAARKAAAKVNGQAPSVPQQALPQPTAAVEAWTPSLHTPRNAVAIPSSAQTSTFDTEAGTAGPLPLSALADGNDMGNAAPCLGSLLYAPTAPLYEFAAPLPQSSFFDPSMNPAMGSQIGSYEPIMGDMVYGTVGGNPFSQYSDATLSSYPLTALPTFTPEYGQQQAWVSTMTPSEEFGLDGTIPTTANFFDNAWMTQGYFETDINFGF